MILNANDIISHNIIKTNPDWSNLKNTSYDIRAKEFITNNGHKHKKIFGVKFNTVFYKRKFKNKIEIPVNGLVVALSKEEVSLPNNIVGFAHIKTSLSQTGILAINTGIIDPGYVGYLSTVLINYSSEPITIKENDTILRLTFHQIHDGSPYHSNSLENKNYENYKNGIFTISKDLDHTFINEIRIIEKSKVKTLTYLGKLIVIVGVVVGAIGVIANFVLRNNMKYSNSEMIQKTRDDSTWLINTIILQNKKIDSLSTIVNKINNKNSDANNKGK